MKKRPVKILGATSSDIGVFLLIPHSYAELALQILNSICTN